MSSIEKLGIIGIRSYHPETCEIIDFFKPLTLIWGHNGAGKTTIIECLKLATTGSHPPFSQNGKTFLTDPKLVNKKEVRGTVKLKFTALNGKPIYCFRSFLVNCNKDKYEFKTVEQFLRTKNEKNEEVSANHTCTSIDIAVPELLGVSAAVLEKVIFCHQEESLWPFGDNTTLKTIFDELFDTTKYTKYHETLKTVHKGYTKRNKELGIKFDYTQKEFFRHIQTKQEKVKKLELLREDASNVENFDREYYEQEQKYEKYKGVQAELQNTDVQLRSSKRKRDDLIQDINNIKANLSKFFEDELETLKKAYLKLQEKYKSYEIEVVEKEKALTSMKINAEFKKNEYEKFIEAEKNDSVLASELKKLRDELCTKVLIQNEGWETEADMNDKIIKKSQELLNSIDSKSATLIEKYKEEEARLTGSISERTRSINIHSYNIEETQRKINETDSKINLLRSQIDSSQKNQTTIYSLQEKITNISMSISKKKEDLLKLEGTLSSSISEQTRVSERLRNFLLMKERKEKIKKLRDIKEDAAAMKTNRKETRDKYEQSLRLLNTKSGKSLLEDLKTFEQNDKELKAELDKMKGIRDKITSTKNELMAEIKILTPNLNKLQERHQALSDEFSKTGILSLVRDADLKEKYEQLKSELNDAEQKFIIMEYTGMELQEYLLDKSENKMECCFCKKGLSNNEVNVLKNKIDQRKERSRKHIYAEKERIDDLRLKKTRFKQKRNEILEFNKLTTELNELKETLKKRENSLKDQNDKINNLSADIDKTKDTLNNIKTAIDTNLILQTLEPKVETKENELKFAEKELQSSLNNDLAEEELFINTNELDLHRELKKINELIRETEQKKQTLQKVITELEKDKSRDETTATALIERNKVQGGSDSELKMLEDLKKDLIKSVSEKRDQLKALNLDKASLTANLEKIQIKIRDVEKENIEKKGLIEYLLPNFIKKLEMWTNLNTKRGKKSQNYEASKMKMQTEINELKDKIQEFEKSNQEKKNELSQKANSYHILERNISLKEKEKELSATTAECNRLQQLFDSQSKESIEGIKLKQKLDSEKMKLLQMKERLSTMADSLEKDIEDITKNDKIELEYMETRIQLDIDKGIAKDLDTNQKALEKALLQYHKTKMDEINKIISDTWRDIYSGGDIKKIQIVSDEDGNSTAKKTSKSYNYRLVCTTHSGKDLEMKGRCSMGQKVLASVVIRLALAEAFGINCGILTLDEPTTNLDTENKKKLAKQLCSLIKSRENNDYFQLIVISHDKDFMQELSEYSTEYYKVFKDEQSFSRISKEALDSK